jgi:PAS domain S-box-containing protein
VDNGFYRSIIEKADFGYVLFSSDVLNNCSETVISDANEAFASMTGCALNAIVAKKISETNCPFFKNDFENIIKNSLTTPVFHFVPEFGKGFHIESIKSDDGEIALIVRDDSEISSAVTVLKEKQEQLKTLINATPDIICFKDSRGRWLEANESNLDVFSLRDVKFVGKDDKMLGEETLPVYKEAFRGCSASDERTWKNGVMSREEEIIPLPDGTPRIFDVIKVPLFYDAAKTLRKGLVVLGRDVTEQKQAENEIKRQAGLIKSLFDTIPDLIFYKNIQGVYIGCNKAFASFVGEEPEHIIGKTDYELFERDVAEEFVANDKIMMAMLQPRVNDEWLEYPDGSRKLVATVKTPYYGSDGSVAGILGISRDITELHRQSQELHDINMTLNDTIVRETEKNRKYEQILFNQKKLADIGNIVSAMAHHWRQPLNAIGLYIQDICQTYKDSGLSKDYMSEFEVTCMQLIGNLSSTIDNFSDFFKPQGNHSEFRIMLEVRDILKIYEAKLAYHGINFNAACICGENFLECQGFYDDVICEYSSVVVDGYKDEFKQAFINVLQNAVDAVDEEYGDSRKDKSINVNVDIEDERVVIRIFNNGRSIPEYVAERIYNPYFTTKGEGKGTGIGLYLTKNIIENYMNGKLYFENIDGGVAFYIILPVKRLSPVSNKV